MSLERRYRAVIEYDGTDFLGYQIQARGRTVQGEIEQTLTRVTQAAVRIHGAGRTDAGVHAIGQVIAFNLAWKHSLGDLHRALNATLSNDIIIRELTITDQAFHPRFSALSRSYRYTIINRPWPAVLERRYVLHIRDELNVVKMKEASQYLLGSQDFASFGKPTQGESTVRQVIQADWLVDDCRLMFDITANAFLYRMVRNIVGTLIKVGLQQLTVADMKQILAARNLQFSASPAPARGLCLMKVTY